MGCPFIVHSLTERERESSKRMNGYFRSAEAAEVGIIQVVEVPENRYDYTLPKNGIRKVLNFGVGTSSNKVT